MVRYKQILGILTVALGVSGVLTAFDWMPWIVLPVLGVIAGAWWAFGKSFLKITPAEERAYEDARSGTGG